MTAGNTVRREGNAVVITIPLENVHSLIVSLAPCPCKAVKSISTGNIRDMLCKALSKAVAR